MYCYCVVVTVVMNQKKVASNNQIDHKDRSLVDLETDIFIRYRKRQNSNDSNGIFGVVMTTSAKLVLARADSVHPKENFRTLFP